jgi:hypothetical protein
MDRACGSSRQQPGKRFCGLPLVKSNPRAETSRAQPPDTIHLKYTIQDLTPLLQAADRLRLYVRREVYERLIWLRLLSRGELSLSGSAELLGLTPGEVFDLAAQRGLETGGTLAQQAAGQDRRK